MVYLYFVKRIFNDTGIYKITNKATGNIYIGQSCNLRSRKVCHFNRLKRQVHSNKKMQKEYIEHGRENFSFDVLVYCEEFELTRYEQAFVDYLNPFLNKLRRCSSPRKNYGAIVKKKVPRPRKYNWSPEDYQKIVKNPMWALANAGGCGD